LTAFLLQHLLRDAVEREPDRGAVNLGADELTYGELEARSNRIARALRSVGVQRGDRVALHLPKSPQAVAALYGILKAGAAYVPIEPSSPGPRLADIVAQCRPRCIVTWSQAREKLSTELCRSAGVAAVAAVDDAVPFGDLGVPALHLDEAAAAELDTDPAVGAVDHDLAYVLFTSGSTGQPKGVMLSHLNALTFVNWARDTFGLGPEDRLSNHAPFNFDLSVLDLFAAAAAGARVTLVPEGLAMFPTRLAELAARERLSVWYSVPSVLTLLLTRGDLAAHDLSSLRWILFAGEVFPAKYLGELMRALPEARYANLYGPTETNVVTWYEVQPSDERRKEPVPIGKPCANSDCIVIAEDGEVVTGPGREGLLHVRGSTVMQGYFGQPEATAAAFLPSPVARGREELLYCTGDWVTIDEQGDFVYLGRRDHMVKTRGYRVELGEIEAALYAHPAVREAAAVAVPDDLLGNRIHAFVVGDDVTAQELRTHCSRVLPRYMVPEEVELIAELPRTTTDKIDRPRLALLSNPTDTER
jgi:amino acid adenylation domain-containing protein